MPVLTGSDNYWELHYEHRDICLACTLPDCIYDLPTGDRSGKCPAGLEPTKAQKNDPNRVTVSTREKLKAYHDKRIAELVKTELAPHLPLTIPEMAQRTGHPKGTIAGWVDRGFLKKRKIEQRGRQVWQLIGLGEKVITVDKKSYQRNVAEKSL